MDLDVEFENAVKRLCDELGEECKNMEIYKDEIAYHAYGKKFEFYLRKSNINTLSVGIYIYYNEDTGSYFAYEKEISNSIPLERYASHAVYSFNIEHNRVNPKSIFGELEMRVYGRENSHFTHFEALIVLEGLKHIKEIKKMFRGCGDYLNNIKAVRFRHIRERDLYSTYTYAFHIPLGSGYWIIFPNLGGPDSGGSNIAFQRIEKLLNNIRDFGIYIHMEYYDIDEEELFKSLYENGDSFHKDYHSYNNDIVFECMYKSKLTLSIFGNKFEDEFEKFKAHYKNNELGTALRDLRTLVNVALKKIFEYKNIPLPEKDRDKTIEKLAGELEGNKIIDHKIRTLFSGFAAISNEPAHDINYGYDDKLVLLTIMLGIQLIRISENYE